MPLTAIQVDEVEARLQIKLCASNEQVKGFDIAWQALFPLLEKMYEAGQANEWHHQTQRKGVPPPRYEQALEQELTKILNHP